MARVRKFVVAVCGMAATLVAAGVLDDTAETVVTGLLGIATALGVYVVPNGPAQPGA
jgi:putative intracellular protease/amidase